ncbi:hypothetical protein [Frankia sp. R43]|nr:hypothetical protein [Frankia sp. R43]
MTAQASRAAVFARLHDTGVFVVATPRIRARPGCWAPPPTPG